MNVIRNQIQIAKMHLGHYMYADVPMFLEINFQGYEDDIDDFAEAYFIFIASASFILT